MDLELRREEARRVRREFDPAARSFCIHLRKVWARTTTTWRAYDERQHVAVLYEPECDQCQPWIGRDLT